MIRRRSCYDGIAALNEAAKYEKELNLVFGMTAQFYKILGGLPDPDNKEFETKQEEVLTIFL